MPRSSTAPSSGARLFDPRRVLWAATFSGVRFHPFAVTPDMVRLSDVTHALSNICRFNGHAIAHYSVAQHSILVAWIVEVHMKRPDLAWTALMHDAPEAYLGDVISPLRRGLPDYKAAYDEAERTVLLALGAQYPLPPEVREADLLALATEARELMPAIWEQWELPVRPLDIEVRPCSPAEAKEAFAQAVRRLGALDPIDVAAEVQP